MKQSVTWKLAHGSCGFNVGDAQVYGAYVNGVALFSWTIGKVHVCVVTGQMTCSGTTIDEARNAGVEQAIKLGVLDADQRLSKKQFEDRLASRVKFY